ncbi:MAG: DNA cytosine methyltransferase, partial [Atribacterota bacterium]|nr:DNA cytosine methyltransferase [Atribacterota bacterium]
FSGAGGMDLGLSLAGIKIIQSLDIDHIACDTLRWNFTHTILEEDITNKIVLEQPRSHVLIGTFPCNKYSSGANLHGTRLGDDLFLHFFRHIVLEQPEIYVIENVPGIEKFQAVIEAFMQLPDYYTQIGHINASIWLPQHRSRIIIFGSKNPISISKPLVQSRIPFSAILEPQPKIHIPNYVYRRLDGHYRDLPIITDPADIEAIAPTCVAHYSKDVSTRLIRDENFPRGVRPYTPREYARLQGFPDSFEFAGTDRDIYKQVGNAVAVPVAEWIGEQIINYFKREG